MRDLLAAVDYFLLRSSTLFMGNIFSSFSFSIRENFFYREAPSAVRRPSAIASPPRAPDT